MTYQPKHRAEDRVIAVVHSTPPSLDYEAWIGSLRTTREPPELFATKIEITFPNATVTPINEITFPNATVTWIPKKLQTTFWEDYSESRAGHEWDGRSWFK